MNRFPISVCYYPTTVVLIDDQPTFTREFKNRLTKHIQLPCVVYNDPQQALHFLTKEYRFHSFIQRCIQDGGEDTPADKLMMEFDIRAIHQEIYNKHRFAEVIVIIVDHAMPELDGLTLCQHLKDTYFKTLMLTAEAGKELAVQAFNVGSIDKFVMKDDPNLMSVIVEYIQELQHDYFSKLSDFVYNKFIKTGTPTLKCLSDPSVVKLFTNICDKHHIVEYYLMDEQGSFLLLNAEGQPSWLAIRSADQMKADAEFAEWSNGTPSVVQALKSRTSLVYFQTEDDLRVAPPQWDAYLYPAQPIGDEKYFYAYIDNPNAYDVKQKHIFSYAEFLKKS